MNVPPEIAAALPEPVVPSLDALEATVSSLRADALSGTSPMPLLGRNIGVVCDDPQRPEVFMLERTAGELGARVALVRPGPDLVASRLVGEQTGKVLGKLYDALICIDMPPWLVRVLRDSSGVPAAEDLGGRWVALQSQRADARDENRYLLKALMLQACA